MKLECPVVKDLYILYKENELSREVRTSVDLHIGECEDCRKVYEREEDFPDILKDNEEVKPSKKLDEKMLLKLKVSRLRVFALFIAAVLLISTYYSYKQSRYNLLYDISMVEQSLHAMTFSIENVEHAQSPRIYLMEDIESINRQNSIIRRDLNLLEKNQLKKAQNGLSLNFSIDALYNVLKTRNSNGVFTARDKKAYSMLKEYMENTVYLLGDERNRLNRLHDVWKVPALLNPIDIKNLSKGFNDMNQLALVYSKYDKFPDEMSPLSPEELEERIRSLYAMDGLEVQMPSYMDSSIRLNGDFDYDVQSKDRQYRSIGTIDAYTGMIRGIRMGSGLQEGDLLPLETVGKNLESFLKRLYGEGINFDIKYLGINHNFSSNVDIKLYSYEVMPVYKGYNVDTPMIIYFDARSGLVYGLMSQAGYDFTIPDYEIDTTVNVDPAKGMDGIQLDDWERNDGSYNYKDTSIIKSMISGKYTLVHVYESNHRKIYVNASTGRKEISY